MPHSSVCRICDNYFSLEELANSGSKNGFVPTLSSDSLTLTKLNIDGTSIICYAIVGINAPCKLVVGSRDVTRFQLATPYDTSALMKILLTKSPCPGNRGFEDVLLKRRSSEITVGFYDKDNKEVAREEPGKVIRHINCHGFVDSPGDNPCETCSNYRKNLRKFRSRILERSFVSIDDNVYKTTKLITFFVKTEPYHEYVNFVYDTSQAY